MPTSMTTTRPLNILRVDASMRRTGSVTRALADDLVAALKDLHGDVYLTNRDLADCR